MNSLLSATINSTSQTLTSKKVDVSNKEKRITPQHWWHCTENSDTGGDPVDLMRPWFTKWNLYVSTNKTIAKDTNIVQWWGVCFVYLKPYNTLNSSLAQCTLVSYMGISCMKLPSYHGIVCFKWEGFSSAGITISKCWNWLKGDIIKALECIKCLLYHDLIFCPTITLDQVEKELEDVKVDKELVGFMEIMNKDEEFTWDTLIDNNKENIVLGISQDEPMVVD